jgi:preprotein translocase subunit Sec63
MTPLIDRMLNATSPYVVLGIAEDSSRADISRAYRSLVLQLSPLNDKSAVEALKTATMAYNHLTSRKNQTAWPLLSWKQRLDKEIAKRQADYDRQWSQRMYRLFNTLLSS